MKNTILSIAIMAITSNTVFANTGALDLACTNNRATVRNQLGIISNDDGSKILLTSKASNSSRGKNFELAVISARRNMVILENAQVRIKVVINTEISTAEIYDDQGLVSTCE